MTVAQLRALLAALPDDLLVVLAQDNAHGACSPLDELLTGHYDPAEDEERGHMRRVYLLHRSPPPAAPDRPINAVALYPVR